MDVVTIIMPGDIFTIITYPQHYINPTLVIDLFGTVTLF